MKDTLSKTSPVETHKKNEEKNKINEEERALNFWKTRLEGETRIKTPQNPQCAFAIVIPVYDEKPERLLRQIESLRNQQGIDSSAFEIIYIVNNDVPDGTEKSEKVIAANRAVLDVLNNVQGLSVFVIDKSSPGKEIKGCNTGKARNRGLAEASLRFHENKKDGILIQSDADSYFKDPDYLKKVKDILEQNSEVLGIAGGFTYEFDPDTSDSKEVELLKAKADRFILLKEWESMIEFLQDPASQAFFQDDSFFGANMISRSFETAVVGGWDDVNAGGNDNFATNLKTLLVNRGQGGKGVLEMKKELLVVTALRESDRTGNSLKKYLEQIDLEKPLEGSSPLVSEISEVKQKILEDMEINLHNPERLRKALSDSDGNLLCGEEGLQELIAYLSTRPKLDLTEPFFATWKQKYLNIIQATYGRLYPKIPITDDAIRKLELQVLQHPNGKEFIDNMRTRFLAKSL